MIGRWRPAEGSIALAVVCAGQFIVTLDMTIVNVALNPIQRALVFSASDLQWVSNAYLVVFAGFLLVGGRLADLVGRRRVFLVGLVGFTVASLCAGIAATRLELVLARGLQGFAGALVVSAGLALAATLFDTGSGRRRALAAWGAVPGLGAICGAIVGGLIVQFLGWRALFLVNGPVGLVLALLALRWIARDDGHVASRRLDLSGGLLLVVSLLLIVAGIVRTDVEGWNSVTTVATLAVGVSLFVVFVLVEARWSPDPLVPLRIFGNRSLTASSVSLGLVTAVGFPLWYFIALYLEQVLRLSPLLTGLAYIPGCVGFVGGARFALRAARWSRGTGMILGSSAMVLAFALLTQVSAHGSYFGGILVPFLLASGGQGILMVSLTMSGMDAIDPRESGLAAGVLTTTRQVGGAIGLAVLAGIAASHTAGLESRGLSARAALSAGFDRAFLVSVPIIALVAVLAPIVAAARPRVESQLGQLPQSPPPPTLP